MKRLVLILFLIGRAFGQGTLGGTGQGSGTGQMGVLPLPAQFSITVAVTGLGTVTASPSGLGGISISCPSACVANYNTGTVVTLTETPGAGQTFSTWGGSCAGSATTCVLTISGNTSVTATFTGSGGGGPFSYVARTDSCSFSVTYAASCATDPTCAAVCNPALTLGEQVSGLGALLQYTEGTSDPVPFTTIASGTANQNNCFTDPDFGTYECWLTDQTPAHMNGAQATATWNMGSSGNYDAFNRDDTMISFQNASSVQYLWHIVPSRFFAHTCSPGAPCFIVSNLKSSNTPDATHFDNNAAAIFSHNAADGSNIMFEISPTSITKLTLTIGVDGGGIPTGVDSIARSTVVDFTSDTPVQCSVLPPGYNSLWNGEATMSDTDTFTVASGGAAPWPAVIGNAVGNGSQAVTSDNFTAPVNNTTISSTISSISGVGGTVTLVTSGTPMTAYSSESIKITATTNYNGTYTLATVNNSTHTYTFIGPNAATETSGTAKVTMDNSASPPVHITAFQVTTPGTTGATGAEPNWISNCPLKGMTCTDGSAVWINIGSVSGQAPGFDIVNYRPGIGCSRINTRLAKLYRGHGNAESGAGQLKTDDATICKRMGGSNCGTGGIVDFTDSLTLHAGSQQRDSRYGSFGATGAGAINNNWGGNGSNLTANANGSCLQPIINTLLLGAWDSGTSYSTIKSVVFYNTIYYSLKTAGSIVGTPPPSDTAHWSYANSYCYGYIPEWSTGLVRPNLELGPQYAGDQHQVDGYVYKYGGGLFYSKLYGQPNCQTVAGCPLGYVGAPNPGVILLANTGCSDEHPTYRNNGHLDLQPFFVATTAVPSYPLPGGIGVPCESYNVEVADANLTSSGGGTPTQWRFGWNWNTGSSAIFGTQNATGLISQLGDILAVSTDGMNSRGDRITGATTCANPLRAQYTPKAPQVVTVGDNVLPVTNNAAQHIYQVFSINGVTTPGTTCPIVGGVVSKCFVTPIPSWNSCQTIGCTVNDPSTGTPVVVLKSLGPNTCRGDVLLFDVLSSHIAP